MESTLGEPDSAADYRERLSDCCRLLTFSGIIGEHRPPVSVQDLFVAPRLEQETDALADTGLMLVLQAGAEAVHPREMKKQSAQGRRPLPLYEAIRHTRNMVILGPPGMGKTTLLKYLVATCATWHTESSLRIATDSGEAFLPLFISLPDYAAQAASRSLDYNLIHHLYTQATEQLRLAPPLRLFQAGAQ